MNPIKFELDVGTVISLSIAFSGAVVATLSIVIGYWHLGRENERKIKMIRVREGGKLEVAQVATVNTVAKVATFQPGRWL